MSVVFSDWVVVFSSKVNMNQARRTFAVWALIWVGAVSIIAVSIGSNFNATAIILIHSVEFNRVGLGLL